MKIQKLFENHELYLIENFLDEDTSQIYNQIMNEANFNTSKGGRKMCRMTIPKLKYTIFGKSYARKNYTPTVELIKNKIEAVSNLDSGYFNTCTLNYYPNGKCGWRNHTDAMPDLEPPYLVATLTLGDSNREMILTNRHDKKQYSLILKNNSLLCMGVYVQRDWLHGIPKKSGDILPRLSLSFRRQKITNLNYVR